jgi:hypothetical protein
LFGVEVSRVRGELQEKVLRYQDECFTVLWNAFKADMLPSAQPDNALSDAAQAVEHARALLRLAEQQLVLEQELGQVRNKQDVMAGYIRGQVRITQGRFAAVEGRMDRVELRLAASETITQAQATELMLAVRQVAEALRPQRDRTGYQQVYDALIARYQIASYTQLPIARYGECLAWLHGWYQGIQDRLAGQE